MSATSAPSDVSGGDASPSVADASPSASSLSVLENAFARFSEGVTQLQVQSQVAQKRLEIEFGALDACVKTHEVLLKEYKKLLQMLHEIEKDQGTDTVLSDYHLKLDLLRCSLDKLRDSKPRNNLGWFMRGMVGQVPMQLWKHADRMRFKDEYNKFKSRTTLLYIVGPVVQLLALWYEGSAWGVSRTTFDLMLKSHQLWLLYYYLTLALRENILLANGSDIHHWWIYHHYLSMLFSLIMLLYPNPYLTEERLREILCFGLTQGLVMLFQNNYQRKRLYVRKTLGKAKAIDVDSSETLVEKPTDLSVLIPMLFSLYAVELWFGYTFIRDYITRGALMHFPVSVLVMGLAFVVLGVGNAYTTALVLVSKSRTRQLKIAVQDRLWGKRNANARRPDKKA